ncbi:MAG: ribosome recycling factor [Clostridia bacterium]|nr:ribosome recycling factor [Clostridia bacterium]
MYLEEYNEDLKKAMDHHKDELLQIRAGRANPKIIERIVVDYYGTMTPINQMATISVPEARMILVSLWDQSMLKTVAKAIEAANLGLNPSDDGKVIRLVFPQLTEERRKELAKEVSKMTESAKVVCRNARRDVLDVFKKMKKDSAITEDEMARLEKDVQKSLDDAIALIDKNSDAKEKEIMEV